MGEDYMEPIRNGVIFSEGGFAFTGLSNAELVDPVSPLRFGDPEEHSAVMATLCDQSVTISCNMKRADFRRTERFFRKMVNSHKRRIRYAYRLKERIRRAKLKGENWIGISPHYMFR